MSVGQQNALLILTILVAVVGAFIVAPFLPIPPSGEEQAPVSGYVDTTNLGFTEAHYYEIHTPDGSVPCIVTETSAHGAGAGIDCDWSMIR